MIEGTIYDITTGRIIMSAVAPSESGVRAQCSLNPNYRAHIGEQLDSRLWYFPDGVKAARPSLELVIENGEPDEDGELPLQPDEILRVTNIPVGTLLRYADGEVIIDDGFIEWSADVAGTFAFAFSNGDYSEVVFYAVIA